MYIDDPYNSVPCNVCGQRMGLVKLISGAVTRFRDFKCVFVCDTFFSMRLFIGLKYTVFVCMGRRPFVGLGMHTGRQSGV